VKKTFLAIDAGTGRVRAFAAGRGKTHLAASQKETLSDCIADVMDEMEEKLGVRFKGAFITGNLGIAAGELLDGLIIFPRRKQIAASDIMNAAPEPTDGGLTLHLIPLRYLLDGEQDVADAEGKICKTLAVKFCRISCPEARIAEIKGAFGKVSCAALGFFDPIYLLSKTYGKNAVFIDFGETTTKAGISTGRGLISRFDLETGQSEATKRIARDYGIGFDRAEAVKLAVLGKPRSESDHYVLVDKKNGISRADIWNAWIDCNNIIFEEILRRVDLSGRKLFITGLAADLINSVILKKQGIEATVLDSAASAGAIGSMLFEPDMHSVRKHPIAQVRGGRIIPSVMCWNINNKYVYKMFDGIGIKRIHVDIMDGFYTDKVMGSFDDISRIRAKTQLFLHTHLMADDPMLWVDGAAKAGSDMIIVSSGARRISESLLRIKELGKKCALAISPDFDLKKLTPRLLRMLDEVMVMGVKPGASGQKFMPETATRIRTLANTRAKYGFAYKISCDGGIDAETAPFCWTSGADYLISGSYLRAAPDFADAVISLLPRRQP
jgi:ribulose-phosphate 3-epimerase